MAPVGVIAAGSAGAAAPLVQCLKPSGFVTFTLGLGTTPKIQTTTFSLPVKGCSGTGGVKSGTSSGKSVGKTKSTCGSLGTAPTTTTVTIKWNNGKSSTSTLKTTIVPGAPKTITATVVGKISKGLFLGKTIKTKVKVTIPAGTCTDAHPLKKATLTGLQALTIS